jgi:hypothetical protein
MAVATTLSWVSGNTNGRIGIDSIKVALTGATAGAWYDVAVGRPDGIGGYRVQADNAGASTTSFVPQVLGAYIVTVYPTQWTTGTVPQAGPPIASISTTGFNMSGVSPDVGMAFPTATVTAATQAASTVSQ